MFEKITNTLLQEYLDGTVSPSFEGLEKFLDVRFYEELKPLTEAQVEEME